ncbi:DedA family protein [Lysinibacillus macroides]|uniref:Alkaline phosphatase n=1 Tax=Lysinibacillus macroides TaxID=33935 RepID=A0A0M9DGU3_9BACI|nr:DedA family protein [Lysinibacillus macroides]KOY80313.1 alkaline phosphatase [Lysinibacillus macroides]QPR67621.1 DedA family protein [Lysinibacillus macroides]
MVHHIQSLIEHYGYLGIIVILIGGIVGLPLPDEVFLTYIGYSVYRENLAHIPALISAMIGAVGGITLSYYIGYRFGLPLLQKYGPKVYITEQKIAFTKKMFVKIGPLLLVIGYFIPGVRHLTAYIAAINNYPYKKFALFAYIGAFIWTFTFISLGKTLGEKWRFVGYYLSHYSIYLILLFIVGMLIAYYLFKKRNVQK